MKDSADVKLIWLEYMKVIRLFMWPIAALIALFVLLYLGVKGIATPAELAGVRIELIEARSIMLTQGIDPREGETLPQVRQLIEDIEMLIQEIDDGRDPASPDFKDLLNKVKEDARSLPDSLSAVWAAAARIENSAPQLAKYESGRQTRAYGAVTAVVALLVSLVAPAVSLFRYCDEREKLELEIEKLKLEIAKLT